jgi:GT2 family glycosyltransferase
MVPLSICIPTLCCPDLLADSVEVLIPQLEEGDVIQILDNGNALSEKSFPPASRARLRVFREARNLGVAASWNKLLRYSFPNFEWVLMLNDDIALGTEQLKVIRERLAISADKWFLTGPYYWSVFAIRRECFLKVGGFDEHFFPAYFEDNDFYRRIQLLDPSKYQGNVAEFEPGVKRNSETIRRMPELNHRFEENRKYYIQKWGGPPEAEKFLLPFNALSNESSAASSIAAVASLA